MRHLIYKQFISIILSFSLVITSISSSLAQHSSLAVPGNTETNFSLIDQDRIRNASDNSQTQVNEKLELLPENGKELTSLPRSIIKAGWHDGKWVTRLGKESSIGEWSPENLRQAYTKAVTEMFEEVKAETKIPELHLPENMLQEFMYRIKSGKGSTEEIKIEIVDELNKIKGLISQEINPNSEQKFLFTHVQALLKQKFRDWSMNQYEDIKIVLVSNESFCRFRDEFSFPDSEGAYFIPYLKTIILSQQNAGFETAIIRGTIQANSKGFGVKVLDDGIAQYFTMKLIKETRDRDNSNDQNKIGFISIKDEDYYHSEVEAIMKIKDNVPEAALLHSYLKGNYSVLNTALGGNGWNRIVEWAHQFDDKDLTRKVGKEYNKGIERILDKIFYDFKDISNGRIAKRAMGEQREVGLSLPELNLSERSEAEQNFITLKTKHEISAFDILQLIMKNKSRKKRKDINTAIVAIKEIRQRYNELNVYDKDYLFDAVVWIKKAIEGAHAVQIPREVSKEYQRKTNEMLSELVNKPHDYDWEAAQQRDELPDLTARVIDLDPKGRHVFSPFPNFRFYWSVAQKENKGWQRAVVIESGVQNGFFQMILRLEKGKQREFKTFQIGRYTKEISGVKSATGIKDTILDISDKLGLYPLRQLTCLPVDFDWEAADREGLIPCLKGLHATSATNASGCISFRPIQNYSYGWPVLGFNEKGWEVLFVDSGVKNGIFEFTVQLTKDKKVLYRTFQISRFQHRLIPDPEIQKKQVDNVFVLHISEKPGIIAVAELVQKNEYFDWQRACDAGELPQLKGLRTGPIPASGTISFNPMICFKYNAQQYYRYDPQKYYRYNWRLLGEQEEGWNGVFEESKIKDGLFQFPVEYYRDEETDTKNFQMGRFVHVLEDQSKNTLQKKEPLEVLIISDHLGIVGLSELVKKSVHFNWESAKRNKTIPDLRGLQLRETMEGGEIPFYPFPNCPFRWRPGVVKEKGWLPIIVDEDIVNGFYQFFVRFDKEDKDSTFDIFQIGPYPRTLMPGDEKMGIGYYPQVLDILSLKKVSRLAHKEGYRREQLRDPKADEYVLIDSETPVEHVRYKEMLEKVYAVIMGMNSIQAEIAQHIQNEKKDEHIIALGFSAEDIAEVRRQLQACLLSYEKETPEPLFEKPLSPTQKAIIYKRLEELNEENDRIEYLCSLVGGDLDVVAEGAEVLKGNLKKVIEGERHFSPKLLKQIAQFFNEMFNLEIDVCSIVYGKPLHRALADTAQSTLKDNLRNLNAKLERIYYASGVEDRNKFAQSSGLSKTGLYELLSNGHLHIYTSTIKTIMEYCRSHELGIKVSQLLTGRTLFDAFEYCCNDYNERLRLLRLCSCLTEKQVEDISHGEIRTSAISRYENKKFGKGAPNYSQFERFAKFYSKHLGKDISVTRIVVGLSDYKILCQLKSLSLIDLRFCYLCRITSISFRKLGKLSHLWDKHLSDITKGTRIPTEKDIKQIKKAFAGIIHPAIALSLFTPQETLSVKGVIKPKELPNVQNGTIGDHRISLTHYLKELINTLQRPLENSYSQNDASQIKEIEGVLLELHYWLNTLEAGTEVKDWFARNAIDSLIKKQKAIIEHARNLAGRTISSTNQKPVSNSEKTVRDEYFNSQRTIYGAH